MLYKYIYTRMYIKRHTPNKKNVNQPKRNFAALPPRQPGAFGAPRISFLTPLASRASSANWEIELFTRHIHVKLVFILNYYNIGSRPARSSKERNYLCSVEKK